MALNTISRSSGLLASTVEVERSALSRCGGVVSLKVKAQYLSSKIASAEDFAEAAAHWKDNELAAERYYAEQKNGWPACDEAVYVIAPQGADHAKIGISANPLNRLRGLVASNWEPVFICALFWVVEGSAFGLEQLSLRLATKSGLEKRGEWIGTNAAGAAYIVGAAAHSLNMKVADSGMWMRQRDELARLALANAHMAA